MVGNADAAPLVLAAEQHGNIRKFAGAFLQTFTFHSRRRHDPLLSAVARLAINCYAFPPNQRLFILRSALPCLREQTLFQSLLRHTDLPGAELWINSVKAVRQRNRAWSARTRLVADAMPSAILWNSDFSVLFCERRKRGAYDAHRNDSRIHAPLRPLP